MRRQVTTSTPTAGAPGSGDKLDRPIHVFEGLILSSEGSRRSAFGPRGDCTDHPLHRWGVGALGLKCRPLHSGLADFGLMNVRFGEVRDSGLGVRRVVYFRREH